MERTDEAVLTRPAPGGRKLIPKMLNHAAYVTHDVEATAEFYEQVLGLEIANCVMDDSIPSTGDPFPYFHIFFRMGDGSTIAFFESPGLPVAASKGHPAYEIFDHIALEVESVELLHEWQRWIESNGVEVVGPTNHEDLILSIYFQDPSGHRVELTTPLDPEWNRKDDDARRQLDAWVSTKKRAEADGGSVSAALIELIRSWDHGS